MGGERCQHTPDQAGGPGGAGEAGGHGAERRRFPRVPWSRHDLGPVILEVQEGDATWRRVACSILDLGEGGIGLLLAEPVAPGARLRVSFPLPSSLVAPFGDSAGERQPDAAGPPTVPVSGPA